MSKPPPSLTEIKDILAWCRAREQPGCTADRLVAMQSFLLNHTSNKDGEEWHWYCPRTAHPSDDSKTTSTTQDDIATAQKQPSAITQVATYLLTLHTYKSNSSIQTFKDHLSGLLKRCTGCVEGYLKAKRVLEEEYLSYTSAASLENFFASIARWELSFIFPSLFPPPTDDLNSKIEPPQLVDIPPSLVHLVLHSPMFFQESSVRDFFEQEAERLENDNDRYGVELSSVVDHTTFPFVGEGHLELLMFPWTDGETEEDKSFKELKTERLKRLGLMLLPPKRSISVDRFPETLPTIERVLSSLFSPAASREPAQLATRKWVIFREIIDCLSDQTIREALVLKLLQPNDSSGSYFRVDRGDRWAEKYCRGKTGRSNLIVTLICSRLGVQDQSFHPIFQCFHLMFNSTGRLFWINAKLSMEGISPNAPAPPNPLDIFRRVIDNPAFLNALSWDSNSDQSDIWFGWIETFVQSFLPVSVEETRENPLDLTSSAKGKEKDVLARGEIDWLSEGLKEAIYFLMESAQHPKFGSAVKVSAMKKAFNILMKSHQSLELFLALSPQRSALSSVYKTYCPIIVGIALSGKDYQDPIWSDIRPLARNVLFNTLNEDGIVIRLGMMGLADILQTALSAKKSSARTKAPAPLNPPALVAVPHISYKEDCWSRMYDTLGSRDFQGVAMLIRVISNFSHLDVLPTTTDSAWSIHHVPSERQACQKAIDQLNQAIPVTRRLLASSIERFANLNDNKTLLELWSIKNVTSSVLCLLLSPNEEIHDSIQALIQQSFNDVSDRADCFRALLKHNPEEGLEGIGRFLDQFVQCATMFPEACAMAKWMVRCLTDVIDVLCHHGGALFRDDTFVAHSAVRRLVPELWSKMCDGLAVIFKRTSEWSKFYENEVMVDWMRDALIFARLMAAQTRTFEGATVPPSKDFDKTVLDDSLSQVSPSRMSTVGKMMISSLQTVLLNLLNWLRITDVETLYQSFELIKTLLDRFKRSQITPETASLEKLNMFTQRGEKHRCNLEDSQLAEISELLSFWDVSDDDVVFSSLSSRSSSRLPTSSKLNRRGQSSSSSRQSSSRPPGSDDEFDDEFPDISESDLRAIDNATKNLVQRQLPFGPLSSTSIKATRPSGSSHSSSSMLSRTLGGTGFGKISKSLPKDKKVKSSSSSRAMKELRKEFKRSAPTIPTPGMKVGFQIKTSHTKSEIEPSKTNRRTDTAASSSSDSSSESSDTDEEQEKQGLAALSTSGDKRAPVVRKLAPTQPVRSIKMMNDVPMKTPAQIRAAQREAAQRTRLRLKPDMDELHRIILKWEPKDVGQYPPGMEPNQLRKIPAQFRDAEDYLAVFAPLLMLECWAQVQKAIEESQNEDRIVVAVTGKQLIDDWVDVDVVVPTGQVNQRYFLTDVDVVQVCSIDPNKQASFFAKVTSFKKGFADIQITIRLHSSRNHHSFISRSKWRLQRVLNLSTMHREFAGLRSLPYFDTPLSRNPGDTLMNAVLKAESFPPLQFSGRDIQDAMRIYAVNEPQAKAVLAAMDQRTTGFVLIQGPPGTGKTKTISGLVGKFLSDRPPPVTNIGGTKRNEEPSPTLKILVCAPSNAAIDEVAKRLKEGLRSSSGKIIVPKIVRVGNDDAINIAVKDVALDELVEQKLNGANSAKNDSAADVERIRKELNELIALRNLKVDQLKQFEDDATKSRALEDDIMKINSRRTVITSQLNKAKDQDRDSNRSMNAARRKARQDVINEADIVCTTLSGAGHDLLSSCNFETVIIDEAAQAVELSALIPLKYECKRCIMVGDPNQLPPTVLSQTADKYNYSESLFVRIQRRAPQNVHLLSIQYRMHPDISKLPSKVFYEGRLADGPEMAKKTIQPWHASTAFSPYKFYNVNSSREMAGSLGHSLKNTAEATVALNIYSNLKSQFPSVDFDYRIGIVTMYKEQKRELIRVFSSQYGRGITSTVDFNTVDGFQGQEKDIIILSCVRAGAPGSNAGIGFLKDSRRMNVALTRAKSSLFIIGHAPTLEGGGVQWSGIVADARERGAMLDYHQYFSFASAPMVDITTAGSLATTAYVQTQVARAPRSPPSAPSAMIRLSPHNPPPDDLLTSKELSRANPHLKRGRPVSSTSSAPVKLEPSKPSKDLEKTLTNGVEEETKPNSINDHPSSDLERSDGLPPLKKRKPTEEHHVSRASSEVGRSSSPGPTTISNDGPRNRVPTLGLKKKGSAPKAKEAPNLFIPPKRKIAKPPPSQSSSSTTPKTASKPVSKATSSILPPFVSSDAPANDSAAAKARFAAFVSRPGGPSVKKK